MKWLIFALGVVLALGGAASIASGAPYMRIEFGWTEVIAGTTALSAGIVTLALGAILGAVQRLDKRVAATGPAGLADGAAPTLRKLDPISTSVSLLPDPALGRPVVATRDAAPGAATAGSAESEPSGPAAFDTAERLQNRDGIFADRHPDTGLAAPPSAARAWSRSEDAARLPSLIPTPDEGQAADRSDGAVRSSSEAPNVVGRYESNGASYVLFSDGTIEVETEAGTHRFQSMQELKAYIDQQDANRAV